MAIKGRNFFTSNRHCPPQMKSKRVLLSGGLSDGQTVPVEFTDTQETINGQLYTQTEQTDARGFEIWLTDAAGIYEGVMDLVPTADWKLAISFNRALSGDSIGNPLFTVRRVSDDTTQDFLGDAETGTCDQSLVDSFIGDPFTLNGCSTALSIGSVTVPDTADIRIGQLVSGNGLNEETQSVVSSIIDGTHFGVNPLPISTQLSTNLTFSPIGKFSVVNNQAGGENISVANTDDQYAIRRNVSSFSCAGSMTRSVPVQIISENPQAFGENAATIFFVLKQADSSQNNRIGFINSDTGDYVRMTVSNLYPNADMYVDPNEAGGSTLTVGMPVDALSVVACRWEFGTCVGTVNGTVGDFDHSNDSGMALSPFVEGKPNLEIATWSSQITQCVVCEALMAAGQLTDEEMATVVANIAAFYGITLA